MADRKARLAVIGAGWSTYTHIPYLKQHPEAELAAICDGSEAALAKATAVYRPLKTYTAHRRMLAEEGLDGVVVAVNHAGHYTVTRDCLEAGLHVLLEKPMTIKARDAHALAELAADRERELIIGYPWHYTPTTIKAREVMPSGWL
jgi:UDP-N-acetylglucosamine 3-dehydrogenase